MKNFSTWLVVLFMAMFWVFRVIVALMAQLNLDFGGITPLNSQLEIILLFVVLVCIILVAKRKLIGGLIYALSYGLYFGTNIISRISTIIGITETSITELGQYTDIVVSLIGVILAVAVLIDLLVDKGRKANPVDKKTDWFYKNDKFDREVDDRADKNNYRTM